jgi:hypothetical protein
MVLPLQDKTSIRKLTAKDFSIHFRWVAAHIGVPGNEIVDKLAKEATTRPSRISSTAIARSTANAGKTLESWHKINNEADQARTKKNKPRSTMRWIWEKPSLKPSPFIKYPKFPRETLSRYFQVITGHNHSANYYTRFLSKAIEEGDVVTECSSCKVENTAAHMLYACPRFTEHRHIIVDDPSEGNTRELHQSFKGQQKLARFLHRSGAFTKDGENFIHKDQRPTKKSGSTAYLHRSEFRPPPPTTPYSSPPPPEPPPEPPPGARPPTTTPPSITT